MLARKEEIHEYDYEYEEEQMLPEQERLEKKAEEPIFKTVLNTTLRSRCRTLFLVASLLAMLTTVGSGISASRGYALVEVQQRADQLEQENERLNIEIAKLRNPQRIKSIAESKLGMSVPKKTYFAHENP